MKRLAIALLICMLCLLAGCGGTATAAPGGVSPTPAEVNPSADDVVEIRERLFVAQINEIYLNEKDYLGKTIKLEGMFTQYTWQEMNMTYYMVYRNSPGCCGADGQAGFEVVWPEGAQQPFPNENDWVEAVGTLSKYEEAGGTYLHVVLTSLTVLPTRGAEFVSQ